MLCSVSCFIAGIGLQCREVQDGVAAHQTLQLCRAEQVDGWAATEHHEAASKGLKLRACMCFSVQSNPWKSRQMSMTADEALPGGALRSSGHS